MATQAKNPSTADKAKAPAATGAKAGTVQVLQVISKRDGFRRAGREWHGTTTVPLAELTPEQYELLEAEPMLVTQLCEVPAEPMDGQAAGETGT